MFCLCFHRSSFYSPIKYTCIWSRTGKSLLTEVQLPTLTWNPGSIPAEKFLTMHNGLIKGPSTKYAYFCYPMLSPLLLSPAVSVRRYGEKTRMSYRAKKSVTSFGLICRRSLSRPWINLLYSVRNNNTEPGYIEHCWHVWHPSKVAKILLGTRRNFKDARSHKHQRIYRIHRCMHKYVFATLDLMVSWLYYLQNTIELYYQNTY
jgi:hypothetical protein